ncbi:uncharacterized protein LOC141613573 [Silene latifolia]|uniref:uncharacterized protein LOC141613573 n=1 Tax=Silene latifolia TaxID=37657 RepID=UPI003D76B460
MTVKQVFLQLGGQQHHEYKKQKHESAVYQEGSISSALLAWGVSGGSLQLLRETLDEVPPSFQVEDDLDLSDLNLRQCRRKICDGHYTAVVRVLTSSGIAPYSVSTLVALQDKHPVASSPSLPSLSVDHHPLVASSAVVLDMIRSFPRGTSCGRDGFRAQHLLDCLGSDVVAISDELIASISRVVNLFLEGRCPPVLGEYIASAPLTPLVKPGGGIRPIAVGTIWRRLVSKVGACLVGPSLSGYFAGLQFGVGVSGGGEVIPHALNRLVEARGGDVGLSMLLADFQNAFNLIRETFDLSLQAWYLDDGTIVGDTLVVGKVLELILEDGPRYGLNLNVDKTGVFWPSEDPRRRHPGVFPPSIARPLRGVTVLGGPVSTCPVFGSELVAKRVTRTIALMDSVARIEDPQCELLLLRACTGISKLYFALRTCSPSVFGSARLSFDAALRSSLEHIVTASGPGFRDWQWRLATFPFHLGGLGVYAVGDVVHYAFLASRLHSADLQARLLRPSGIVVAGPTFDDALRVFNEAIGSDFSRPCPACSRVFADDIFGDHAVSCTRTIGVKHHHNLVRDTLSDICYRSGILVGKEVDIRLIDGHGGPLRLADLLLYSWDRGRDVCVDLTGSSPLTQTGLADFVPGQVVADVAQRKCAKYRDFYTAAGYGFLPFSFSSLGELDSDAIALLKRIQKFSVSQDAGARIYGLDVKFWGVESLKKIFGVVGKFIKSDDATFHKNFLGFSRLLIEVEIG